MLLEELTFMFLLFFHSPLYFIINLPLVLDLSIVLTHHLLGLWSDDLFNESLLCIFLELLKFLLPLLHYLRKLLSLLKVGIMDNSLFIVLLFNNLLCAVPEALLELALHDILRLLLPEPVLLVLLLALDLLGLVDGPHHRDLVLIELPLPLLVLHPLLLVQHHLELLPYYRPSIRFYLSLFRLLLLELLQILLNIESILYFLDLKQLLPLLLATHLRLQRLQMLLHLHLPLLHGPLLLKLRHLTLLSDHSRPLVHVATCVQRQVADDRLLRVLIVVGLSREVGVLVAASPGGVTPELLIGLLGIVQFEVGVQDLRAVWGRYQTWCTHLLLPKCSYF
jgi:hypothetical protein